MLRHEEITGKIIGAALEVHKTLGCGFLEAVYQEALAMEMARLGLKFVEQQELDIWYKAQKLRHKYKPDFMVENVVVVELKALSALTSADEAQAINYLKASGCTVGLLFNFGTPALKWKRLVFDAVPSSSVASA